MNGQTFGRYVVAEQLGEGGFGTVYRADDPRLGRAVAIKVLHGDGTDERAMTRFRQEARVLSRLLHPNIATLFDFDAEQGKEYLVLEFVDGETLARALEHGALPESRARAIGAEVADALQFAHEEGVVHRDLKPGNIMLTPRGRAKVLDFGLARLLQGTPGATGNQSTALTGTIVGTLPYMAPEQVLGDPVDARTDIFALGIVLFEMVAGRLPYDDGSPARLVYDIAHKPPPNLRVLRPDVSEAFVSIVERCLEKDPGRRFPAARALADALRAQDEARPVRSSGSSPRIRSIAILPLENRSGDAEQDFFTEGMTDALIADLARIGALRVISRTSAMQFKGSRRPVAEIARDLNVEGVVEGSVLRSGNRVRISAQLVDARRDATIWAQSYDGDLSDILSLQTSVVRAIVDAIRLKTTPEEQRRLEVRATVHPDAHVAYLRGRYAWNRWERAATLQSIQHFQEALAHDPTYARAYAGLADSYNMLGNTHALPPTEAYARAREAVDRGLALDPELADLHAALGYLRRFNDWDWAGAERAYLRAIELNPGYPSGRSRYALLLSGLGRHEEAVAQAERALELDPLSLLLHSSVGDVFFYARRYEESTRYYRRAIEMDPSFGAAHTDLARSLHLLGRNAEALEEFERGAGRDGAAPSPSTGYAIFLAQAGQGDAAARMIEELERRAESEYVSPYGIASYHAVVGNMERALDWLDRAFEVRDGTLVWMKVNPRFDPLRAEPRFRDMLGRLRLA